MNISLRPAAPQEEPGALPAATEDKRGLKDAVPLVFPPAGNEPAVDSQAPAEAAGQSPARELAYYPSSQLTNRPAPLNEVVFGAAETAALAASGKIVLTLVVSETGEVIDAFGETTGLPDQLAVRVFAAFKQLRFKPGDLNGQRVGAVMKIEVGVEEP